MTSRVPEFPEFCEVGLELGEEVRPYLAAAEPGPSEFTFSNLFLFRAAHGFRLSRHGSLLLVTGRGYDGRPYAFPPLGPGDPRAAARLLCEYLAAQGVSPELFPVSAEMVSRHYSGPEWTASPDRDQADYLYLREELATLPGKKFHKKRNRLLKFLKEEAEHYVYSELRDEHAAECAELAQAWCHVRCSLERPSSFLETQAAREAVVRRRELGLSGAVILLGGRVAAFCLGERLNEETFVVHFEKSEAGREGLAQLINRDFCRHALSSYRYVNREQDLGDPGLRQAKESYHPVSCVEKFRVSPR